MIVLNLELDNLFGFEDFKINFSYPKKIENSSIKDEFLKDRPNFRYKKVNILLGANSTGKTSIGKAMMAIFNFLNKKEIIALTQYIRDIEKEMSFSIDFILDSKNILYRVNLKYKKENEKIDLDLYKADILKNDSYETTIEKFKKLNLENESYIEVLDKLKKVSGWLFTYPEQGSNFLKSNSEVMDVKIFENILKTLDPSIEKVRKLDEVKNSYILTLKGEDLIIQDGEFVKKNNILSSGTKAGLDIAYIMSAIKKNTNVFYYCDEKFPYIHSDVEKAILSLMIDFLKPNTQLFFTTHNLEILDMNLPIHCFTFLKKREKIEVIYASEYLSNKDNFSEEIIKNDIFNVAPYLDLIYELEEV
ncbi:AAA family ATPase [Fusobacterium nucleatum]|uniref:AAA family ATPase n=1 Tax=Fusobacterium nucleatum TaxID=851 RepID=UPI0001B52874|nr:AAA family ATPase [Fusobacterium nucleatum]